MFVKTTPIVTQMQAVREHVAEGRENIFYVKLVDDGWASRSCRGCFSDNGFLFSFRSAMMLLVVTFLGLWTSLHTVHTKQ